MEIGFQLNGKKVFCNVPPETPLLTILRKMHIYSVRPGCDSANCGICTVWVEERPVLACSFPSVRVIGKNVTTVEGIPEEAKRISTLLAWEGADQCGFCAPGFIMTVAAMKRDKVSTEGESIEHYLNGNLCRCSGYKSQSRAIRKFLAE